MPTVESNGITLYYETHGAGEPLLLIHGLGSRSRDWAWQTPVLAEHYRVITADMRGHGQSDKPPGPYSVPMMATDVVGLLDALAIPAAHVIGLSMGGMIGFQLAVDYPDRLRSLVIVNSTPSLVAVSLADTWRVGYRYLLAWALGMGPTSRVLSRRLFPKEEQAPLRRQMVAEWRTNNKPAYLSAMRALIGWDVMDRISTIRCPTLVISGDRDYLPLPIKERYTAQIPGARLVVVADSGHATPIDQSDVFNSLILEFLAREGT